VSSEPVTVLVPHDEGERALAGIEGLELVRYDEQSDALPDAADRAAVLIPGFLATNEALELVERCPRLRLVQLLSAGAEMWVGRLPEGVQLSDCQGAHGGVTAEWVLAATLAVLREIPVFVRAQDEGRWDQHLTDTLTGKRVLLVGAGDLAEQTARRLETFDVATITRVGRRARDGVHATSELPDLLPDHDVVVLLIPLTDETRGMVDAAFLAAMPDGALLVNAARGPVVDTDALIAELRAERLRAVVDVVDPEPLPADHPLWSAPNLLITPHVGGSVPGHLERAYRVVRTQLEAVARGEDPPNLVTEGY
jgi:phosphoglycerate dehydrogenase-like enzyme